MRKQQEAAKEFIEKSKPKYHIKIDILRCNACVENSLSIILEGDKAKQKIIKLLEEI